MNGCRAKQMSGCVLNAKQHIGIRRMRKPREERFWDQINFLAPNGCWDWTGCKTKTGYGKISIKKSKYITTHRFSWILKYGEIPKGLCVCHSCDRPSCVRPSHLFLGTQKDNIQDATRKGRMSHGEQRWNSKIKSKTIKTILKMRNNGMFFREIGNVFGVGRNCISNIVKKKSWKHI